MTIELLKSKIHRVKITQAELHYVGSITIDEDLMDAADIIENEKVQVVNINNGERFTTYAIRAEANSKIISVNGAAAHKANPGDRVIICAYGRLNENEISKFKPTLVYLDEENNINRIKDHIPVQAA